MESQNSMEMPRYRSHNTVWALKIKEIVQSPADKAIEGGSYEIIPEDSRYAPITVTAAYVDKHNPQAGGYYVVYKDGYHSFSPAPQFEEGNRLESDLKASQTWALSGIGWAVKQLQNGDKVRRSGWNGKGMFLVLCPSSVFVVNRKPYNEVFPEGTEVKYQAHVDMFTADGTVVPWLASQTDLLAIDWEIAE